MSKVYIPREDLPGAAAQIEKALLQLTPEDNFAGWSWSGELPAGGAEVRIRNKFRDGQVPNRFILTDARGAAGIVRGTTEWNSTYVFLANPGATTAQVSVFFYRTD